MKDYDALDLRGTSIAVIGMAGRFPGSRNVVEFWRNLRDGVESIRFATGLELEASGESPAVLQDPSYVRAVATLPGLEMFDASFFGFSPKDAAMMDPQHRHFIQCAWEAIEHAGHDPDRFAGATGVYAGCGLNTYLIHNLLTNPELAGTDLFLIKNTGNDKDLLATRVSYLLNLRGPSVNVQTACSTSLVAIHMACQSLLNHECDMALAGGVTIEVPHGRGYLYREGEILSRDGHCRSFSAEASGTVFGSGVGVVVLRRLQDALADGDCIHALVRGSAINNDGARKVGYLAPSVQGQAEVIAEALSVAGVDSASISYVEAHGTGTRVGDPIEIKGLNEAFGGTARPPGSCAIGSVKSNIGHVDTAAGVAGFIKTVLALEHKLLPPSLHCDNPNPLIEFEKTPFFVNQKPVEWKTNGGPRRAGVTSLGIGGTNCHAVLEEAPPAQISGQSRPWQLLLLSARSSSALTVAVKNLGDHLVGHGDLNLSDVAYTCQVGRRAFRNRCALVCENVQEAVLGLRAIEKSGFPSGGRECDHRPVAFLFPGQGSQYINMGLDLYRSEPTLREEVDRCSEVLLPHLGADLRSILFPTARSAHAAQNQINETWITQPALFVIAYALAKLWMSWGIQPEVMLGHSIGEYVAACLAGVLSLEDALAVVAARGRMMQELPAGRMMAVRVAEQELQALLSEEVSIAAVNGPSQCVVSGPVVAIEQLEQTLNRREILCHCLNTSHAFHSQMMDSILTAFTEVVAKVTLKAPRIPYLSNVTGTWVTAGQATDPAYWAMQLRKTVQFNSGLLELFKAEERILLEVGPGRTLTSLAGQHPQKAVAQEALASLPSLQEHGSDSKFLLTTLGRLWVCGRDIDWSAFYKHERRQRVPLPTYPFERQRYWIEGKPLHQPQPPPAVPPVQLRIKNWFYRCAWRQSGLEAPGESLGGPGPKTRWLVFSDTLGLGSHVSDRLRSQGHDVATVTCGTKFGSLGDGLYTIRPAEPSDYEALTAELAARDQAPQKILHLWSLVAHGSHGGRPDSCDPTLDLSFYSLLFLAQALGNEDLLGGPLDIGIVSNNLWALNGEMAFLPERGTLLGPCRVIPKEFPGVRCRAIDISLPLPFRPQNGSGKESGAVEEVTRQIISELWDTIGTAAVVAYRGKDRWIQSVERTEIAEGSAQGRLRPRGVYLITGGLGGLGLATAEFLARSVQARVILLGRTGLPARNGWRQWLLSHDDKDRISQTIRKLQALEQLGAEILVAQADVTSLAEVSKAVIAARNRFGKIDGVFHAAGVLDDGGIQRKSRESAYRVLSPKVKGTLVLSALLENEGLDFLVLFSSISAMFPPAGQVDYAGANAFLNVFAQASTRQVSPYTVAVDWSAWREVGMAVRASEALSGRLVGSNLEQKQSHPWLGRCVVSTNEETTFSTVFGASSHWILTEHQFKGGPALFPGTGYFELAAAALGTEGKPFEIRNVSFTAPLMFGPDTSKEVRIKLVRQADSYEFSVTAPENESSDSTEWHTYASGYVGYAKGQAGERRDLHQIKQRCDRRGISFAPQQQKVKQDKYFKFGPRWKSLRHVSFGEREALAFLELPEEYSEDLKHYHLHPALLDMATGVAFLLIPDYDLSEDLCLPLSYQRLVIRGSLPRQLYSHVTLKKAEHDIAVFDVTIMDGEGVPIAEIQEFCVRRIYDKDFVTSRHLSASASVGISPAEGSKVLDQILRGTAPAQLIVSPLEILPPARGQADGAKDDQSAAPRLPRHDLQGTYVSPSSEVEKRLTGWLEEMLGVERVGVNDDFFELGGHSLLAARLFAKVKKTWNKELPLSTLFEAPTVSKLAEVISQNGAPLASSAIVPITPIGSKPSLYLVSGEGSDALLFRSLARLLGPDQPIFALQPPGLDGKQPFLTRLEDIAAHYVREVRRKQPQGPYYLGGYSFGGYVVFEMAHQLLAQGQRTNLLAILDTRVEKSFTFRERKAAYWRRVRRLRGRERLNYIAERVRRAGSNLMYRLGQVMDHPLPRSVVNIKDTNRFASANYTPTFYPGRVTLFRTYRPPDLLGADDHSLGWDRLASEIEVHEVAGTHANMTEEPHVQVLAAKLRSCLDKGRDSRSEGELTIPLRSPVGVGELK